MHLGQLQDPGRRLSRWPGPAPVSVCPQRWKLHKPDLSQLQEDNSFRCLTALSLGTVSRGVLRRRGLWFQSPPQLFLPRTLLESTRAHWAGRSWGPGRAAPHGPQLSDATSRLPAHLPTFCFLSSSSPPVWKYFKMYKPVASVLEYIYI